MAEDLASMFKKQTDSSTETKANATPAATGEKETEPKDHRTFTQEEVNRIVSERLNREREKAAQGGDLEWELDLSKRENILQCKELIRKDEKYPLQLLDILDTTDFKKFKETADKLLEAFPNLNQVIQREAPTFTAPLNNPDRTSKQIEEIFMRRN